MKNNNLLLTNILFYLILLPHNTITCKDIDISTHISKTKPIGKYVPKDLIKFCDVQVCKCIVRDLKNLIISAKNDNLTLKVVSGYRSYERQKKIFCNYVKKEQQKDPKISLKTAIKRANRYSALPGHSEHQLGTVVDILSSENNYQFSSSSNLKYISWLENNAHKYNFKISYPKNNKEYIYEPWHIRWWPKKAP